MKKIITLLVLLLVVAAQAQQTLPPKGEVFRDDVLPTVYITLPADSLAEILDPENRWSNYHYKATFVYDNGTVRDTIDNIGFRLRGNTSREAAKKSFKISFNEFESGRKYHGVEKLNLNGNQNDPTISRAKLSFDLLDYLDVPASRANHVKLYINGDYFGLYINIEHIDEEFTQSRYASKGGNLYKCLYGADLAYIGASPNNYKLDYYELKEPIGATDYVDLANFIDVLNNTPDANFECELENIFNVNSYLKSVVMDVLTGNWDGPNYNKNNFYLYNNPKTGQFEYIPYDLDNTFGVDFIGRDWSVRDMYNWSRGTTGRPLFDKIITRPVYKKRFTYLMQKTIDEYFNIANLQPKLNAMKSLVNEAAKADTVRPLDYGFTISDFDNSFGYFSNQHVKFGLTDYITRRENATRQQIDASENVGPLPFWYTYTIDYANDSIRLTIHADGKKPLATVEVEYNWDNQSALWKDTLKAQSGSEDVYSTTIAWHPTAKSIGFLFRMKDTEGVQNELPSCNMYSIDKIRTDIPLYINELMADNESGIQDEEGKNEDWIELYYGGDNFVNPGVLYLTDDLNNPTRFPLVLGTIGPKSFHLIWADDDEDDGRFHANFKLGKGGEDLAIFDANGAMIDWVSFGEQTEDVSYGRVEDGGEEWTFFEEPTPDASNSGITAIADLQSVSISLYPNPTTGSVSISTISGMDRVEVYDQCGRLLMNEKLVSNQLQIPAPIPGLYLVKLIGEDRVVVKKVIVKQ